MLSTLGLAVAMGGTMDAAPAEQHLGVTRFALAFFADSQPSTALDMVGRLPGFTLDLGDQVRGFEGAAGNVLVDGARPASKSDSLEDVLRRIPVSQVSHVELIRGGAPGIDMQGKSVIANVVRKSASKTTGVVVVWSNYAPQDGVAKPGARVEAVGRTAGVAWEGSLRYFDGIDDEIGDGPHRTIAPSGALQQDSDLETDGGFRAWTGTGALQGRVLGGDLKVNLRAADNRYRYRETDIFRAPAGAVESSDLADDKQEMEIGVRFGRKLGDAVDLELLALRQAQDGGVSVRSRTLGGNTRFDLGRRTAEGIGRVVVKIRPLDALSLEVGGEMALNTLESRTAYAQNGVAIALPAANVEVEEDRREAFGKAVWRVTPQWTVEAGLKHETSTLSSTGDVRLDKALQFSKPRLSLSWAPAEGTQVRLVHERTVGQLNFDDFVASSSIKSGLVTSGNPNIEPEQAWVSEISLEQRFWTRGSVGLTLRRSQISDVIDRAPVVDPDGEVFDAPSNIGDGSKDEVEVEFALPLDRFGLAGGLLRGQSAWRRSEVTDPTTLEKREISGLKPVKWEAHFTHDLAKWNATWGLDVWGANQERSYRFDEISVEKINTYFSMFGEYRHNDTLSVRVEIGNLTGVGPRYTQFVYAGPRNSSSRAYADDRDLTMGQTVFVRIRKTLG